MWLCLLLKLGLPEQAVGWFPPRFGLVVEDKPTEFSYIHKVVLINAEYDIHAIAQYMLS